MRIPQELKDALDKASGDNKRSLTAEVVARLEESFDRYESIEAAAINSGVEASMLREEVARLTKLLQEASVMRLLPDSASGTSFAPSLLTKLAGRLHDLQGRRNTLALVANALKQSNADTQELLQVQEEIERLDAAIANTLIDMQRKNPPTIN